MAVLEDIVLVADGGDLTVGRRAATYVYGSFEVILPDGMEPTKSDGRLQDGYIYRPDDSGAGRFDVGFVRADATVDMEAQISDVESVLDAAQKRVEGDVFFERDITTAGLGEYRPGVDFETGDIVSVELWGKRFPSPITAIDYVSSDSEGIGGARVHAGGQLIADPVALRKQNSALQKQIASEKARRMREVANIRTGLTGSWNGDILAAVRGSSGALGTLNQVDIRTDGEVENVRRGILGEAQNRQFETLGGMNQIGEVLRDNFLNRYYQDEDGRTRNMLTSSQLSQAEAGLIPAYVTMNNIMWEQQMLVNAVHSEAIEALQRSIFSVTFMNAGQTTTTTDGFLRFTPPNFGQMPQHVGITRLSSRWRGKIIVLVNYLQMSVPPDFRVQVYERTHSSFGSGTSFDLNIGSGDVQNITFFHKTDNPDEL